VNTLNTRNIVISIFLAATAASAAPANAPVKFDEVYGLLRSNLTGVSQADLDRAMLQGLVDQLPGEVKLEGGTNSAAKSPKALAQVAVYRESYAYFRISNVEGNIAEKLKLAYDGLLTTNKIKTRGVVLDLRFAGGTDYAAAAATANCFLDSTQALLDWGSGSAGATQKTNAISVPLAILVNSKTSGSAEALAAALREANTGLILGGTTAGAANIFKEFTLSNGEKLLIATSTVKLGDGSALDHALQPDIAVDESLADEQAYLKDPYKVLHPTLAKASVKNQPTRRPTNEAELVRERRESQKGDDESDDTADLGPDIPAPLVIADAALARALDLLKGIAVLQQSHPG
jgi:hypothetical protein